MQSTSKYNTNCCVFGCHSRKGADRTIHFHYFPSNNRDRVKILNALGQEEKIDRRKAWEKVLLMGKPVSHSMRVCSKHFKNEDYCSRGVKMKQPKLTRLAVPSLNLPEKTHLTLVDDYCHQSTSGLDEEQMQIEKRQKVKESRCEVEALDFHCGGNNFDVDVDTKVICDSVKYFHTMKSTSKYNTNCCVFGCHSWKGADRTIHFHSFPSNNRDRVKILNSLGKEEKIDRRKAWEKVLLMGKPVSHSMRVCSKHFKNEDYCSRGVKMIQPKLTRLAVPSLNLPEKTHLTLVDDYCHQSMSELHEEQIEKSEEKRQKVKESSCEVEALDFHCAGNNKIVETSEETIAASYGKLSTDEKFTVQTLLNLRVESDPSSSASVDTGVQVTSSGLLLTFTSKNI